MKETIVLSLTTLFSFCTFSVFAEKEIKGNGHKITQEIALDRFDRIELSIPVEIEIVSGSRYLLTLEGDENLLAYIKTDVEGDKMIAKLNEKDIIFKKVRAKLTTPEPVKSLTLAGVTVANINAEIDHSRFKVISSGICGVKFPNIKTSQLKVVQAGIGEIRVTGTVKSLNVLNSGIGSIDCDQLSAEEVECVNSGMGTVRVNASERLKMTNSGMGKITYGGSPKEIKKSNSGLGWIKKK